MLTILIISAFLIVTGSIIAGIVQAENSDLVPLHAAALMIVLIITIATLTTDKRERIINSSTLVNPSMKIETIQNGSNIIKSDTTYTYKFKKIK